MGDTERNRFWQAAFTALVRIARGWTAGSADGEDLAQVALTDAWQEMPEETDVRVLVKRAAWIIKDRLRSKRRATKRRSSEKWLGAAAETTRGLRRTPEQVASTRERKEKLLGRVREALADDEDALAILGEMLEDHTTPTEQAEGLAWAIERVRNARKRVDRAVTALSEGEEAAPDSARGWDDAGGEDDAEREDEGGNEAEA
jgi:hypothetical protein